VWAQGTPIDPVGDKLRGDVGNSFVFSLDLLASLLDVARTGHAELLRPYVPHVDRSLKWVEDNVVESVIARPGETAASVGGGYLRGWRSNHLRGEGGPIMWCTAQVGAAGSPSSNSSRDSGRMFLGMVVHSRFATLQLREGAGLVPRHCDLNSVDCLFAGIHRAGRNEEARV
jgi:hypothetical protein